MPACTVLLFYRNNFIDVHCHTFTTIRVTLELMSHRSQEHFKEFCIHTHMLAAIAERPGVQG